MRGGWHIAVLVRVTHSVSTSENCGCLRGSDSKREINRIAAGTRKPCMLVSRSTRLAGYLAAPARGERRVEQ
eukprot:2776906-Pleurochrysis_carterae.AAC.1